MHWNYRDLKTVKDLALEAQGQEISAFPLMLAPKPQDFLAPAVELCLHRMRPAAAGASRRMR
jgi:hypothetical protein